MKISSYGISDVGLVRQNNEDSFFLDKKNRLFVLADGMGGHNAGEVASATAIEKVVETFFAEESFFQKRVHDKALSERGNLIKNSINNANRLIYLNALKDYEISGMGTTLEILTLDEENQEVYIGHLGDSRVYRFRNNNLTQLTRDHSSVYELVERNILSKDGARKHPYSHILTNALGIQPLIFFDLIEDHYKKDDLFLLCSDGLTDMISDEVLKQIIRSDSSLKNVLDSLVSAAKFNDGLDNITIIVVRIDEV